MKNLQSAKYLLLFIEILISASNLENNTLKNLRHSGFLKLASKYFMDDSKK